MDKKIREIEKINSKAGKEIKDLEKMDKKRDKMCEKKTMKKKGNSLKSSTMTQTNDLDIYLNGINI